MATIGVIPRRRSSALAVETVSLLEGSFPVGGAIPRKEQVEPESFFFIEPEKIKPTFPFSEGFLFDLVHDATGGCAIAGDGEVKIG